MTLAVEGTLNTNTTTAVGIIYNDNRNKLKDTTVHEDKSHGNGLRKADLYSYEAKILSIIMFFSCNWGTGMFREECSL